MSIFKKFYTKYPVQNDKTMFDISTVGKNDKEGEGKFGGESSLNLVGSLLYTLRCPSPFL